MFVLAIRALPDVDKHKRLMLLAAISILDAAVARWFLTFLAPAGPPGPPPVAVAIAPAIVAYLLIVAAAVYEWRTRGKPDSVYVIGGGVLLAMKLISVPLSATAFWQSIAGGLMALAG